MSGFDKYDDHIHDENYWMRFKLRRDPFSRGEEGDYYPILQWQHYFEIFEHKLFYSTGLVAVIGDNDSGKSSLVQNFQAQYSGPFTLSLINAHLRFDARELLEILTTAFNARISTSTAGDILYQFKSAIEVLTDQEKKCVLIIDDAHQVTEAVLEIIVQLIQWQGAERNVSFILVGEEGLQHHLNKLMQQYQCANLLHVVRVEPLSHDATFQYIEQSLQRAGGLSKGLLSDEDMERIYRLSEGYIGRINQMSKQMLSKKNLKAKPLSTLSTVNQLRVIGATTLILFAVAFAWLLRENGDQTAMAAQESDQLVKVTAPAFADTKNVVTTSTVDANQQEVIAVKTDEINPQQKIKPPSETLPTAVIEKHMMPLAQGRVSQEDPDAALSQAEEPESPTAEEEETNELQKPVVMDKVIVIPEVKHTVKEVKPLDNEINIRAKPSVKPTFVSKDIPQPKSVEKTTKVKPQLFSNQQKSYTIQLLGTSSYGALKHFVATNGLSNKINYTKEHRNGKDWYVLFYGSYTNRQQANADMNKLSAEIKKLNPWVKLSDNSKELIRIA